jgi:hypothetical protein
MTFDVQKHSPQTSALLFIGLVSLRIEEAAAYSQLTAKTLRNKFKLYVSMVNNSYVTDIAILITTMETVLKHHISVGLSPAMSREIWRGREKELSS